MAMFELKGKKVLVVEDEDFTRTMVAKLLKTFEPAVVATANNGQHAIDVLEKELGGEADLIISDFRMPIMNGIEFLKRVRADETPTPRETPFALLTGYADTGLVGLAIELDVSTFIAKPLSRASLVNRLERMASDPPEFKPAERYSTIDVTSVEAPSEESWKQPSATMKKRPVRPSDAGSRTPTKVFNPKAKKEKTGSKTIVDVVYSGPERKIKIADLKTDQVLSRDLTTSNGKKLLGDGTKMSKRLLMRLQELQSVDKSLQYVWVRAKK